MLNKSDLQKMLNRLRFFSNLFNRCSKENNFDGAFVASEEIKKIKEQIKDYTNWSDIEILSKY